MAEDCCIAAVVDGGHRRGLYGQRIAKKANA